jgi:hypothetical protein
VRLCFVVSPSCGSVVMPPSCDFVAIPHSCDFVVILHSCDFVRIGCFNTLAVFCANAASVSIRLLGFLFCCAHLSFVIKPKKL